MARHPFFFPTLVGFLLAVLVGGCGGDGFENPEDTPPVVDAGPDIEIDAPNGGEEDAPEVPACGDDAECPVAEICVDGECVVGCRSDGACALDEICLAEVCVERGVGCRSNGDCDGALICDPTTSRCVEDQSGCADNDSFEPNDNLAEATSVGAGRYEGLKVCPGDNDYYEVPLTTGEILSVTLHYPVASGDLDLQVLSADGEPLLRGETATDDEEVSYTPDADMTVYLRIFGADSEVSNHYDLEFTVSSEAICTADSFEPNDSQETATPSTEGIIEGMVCADDEDWFDFNIDADQDLTVTVASSGPITMVLFDEWGDDVASPGQGSELAYAVTWAGTYSLRVASEEDAVPYQLDVSIHDSSSGAVCTDAHEPNNESIAAATIEPGRIDDLTMCEDDEDYYAVELDRLETLTVEITFDSVTSDIEMTLLGPDLEELDGSHGFTGTEEVSARAPTAGTYYVRVYEYRSSATTSYTMSVDVEEAPAPPDCADAYEPNDGAAEAAIVDAGTTMEATSCVEEDDYYAVEIVEPGSIIKVDYTYETLFGVAEVSLLAPDGTTVIGSIVTSGESLSVASEEAGTYLIRVANTGDSPTTYVLGWTVLTPPTCADDPFEPNDAVADATLLDPGMTLSSAIVCPGDVDLFSIRVETGAILLRVEATYTETFGGMNFELLDSDGETVLRTAPGIDGAVSLGYGFATPKTVYIRAFAPEGESTVYDISASLSALSECVDAFEPNNSISTASPIDEGIYERLSLCDGDDDADYYALDLSAGDEVSVLMEFVDSVADLDLRALAPNGTTSLDTSASTSDQEDVSFSAGAAGTYYIKAYHFSGDPNSYTLTVTIDRFVCVDDANEEDDASADATVISAGEFSGILCSGDPDFYAITTEPNKSMVVTVTFDDDDGDLSLRLLGSDGQTELVASDTSTDNEAVTLTTGASAETVYVEINANGQASAAYTVTVQYLPPPPGDLCSDAYEPNNTVGDAAPISPGLLASVGLCDVDDETDYYRVAASAGDEIRVDLGSPASGLDLDLHLYDTNGTSLLAGSSSSTAFESVDTIVDRDGEYYIKVNHFRGPDASYYLDVSVAPWVPAPCDDDLREEDDGPARAPLLSPGTYDGTICFHDPDWIAIPVSEAGTLSASLTFSNDQGDLDLYLLRPDSTTVYRSATTTYSSTETITQSISVPGVYYLRVEAKEGDQNAYTLRWSWQ